MDSTNVDLETTADASQTLSSNTEDIPLVRLNSSVRYVSEILHYLHAIRSSSTCYDHMYCTSHCSEP